MNAEARAEAWQVVDAKPKPPEPNRGPGFYDVPYRIKAKGTAILEAGIHPPSRHGGRFVCLDGWNDRSGSFEWRRIDGSESEGEYGETTSYEWEWSLELDDPETCDNKPKDVLRIVVGFVFDIRGVLYVHVSEASMYSE